MISGTRYLPGHYKYNVYSNRQLINKFNVLILDWETIKISGNSMSKLKLKHSYVMKSDHEEKIARLC